MSVLQYLLSLIAVGAAGFAVGSSWAQRKMLDAQRKDAQR